MRGLIRYEVTNPPGALRPRDPRKAIQAGLRRPSSAKPGDNRIGYELVVPITIPDRRELEERARKEMRSLSSYVAKLIVQKLDRVSRGC